MKTEKKLWEAWNREKEIEYDGIMGIKTTGKMEMKIKAKKKKQ